MYFWVRQIDGSRSKNIWIQFQYIEAIASYMKRKCKNQSVKN